MKLFLFLLTLVGLFGMWVWFLCGSHVAGLCTGLILAIAAGVRLAEGSHRQA